MYGRDETVRWVRARHAVLWNRTEMRYLLPILGYALCGAMGLWIGSDSEFRDFALAGGLIAGLISAAVIGHYVGGNRELPRPEP